MGAVGNDAGTGNMSAPVSVGENAIAKGDATVTDAELMREALEALEAALQDDEVASQRTPPLMALRFDTIRQARAAITKLEARLLNE